MDFCITNDNDPITYTAGLQATRLLFYSLIDLMRLPHKIEEIHLVMSSDSADFEGFLGNPILFAY